MKNNFIYITVLSIIVACSTPKQFIKNDNECSDNDNIFGEKLYKLDTTDIKNISPIKRVFFENDTIKKSIALNGLSTIALYIENKIHNRSKWLYYKNLKLFKEWEVFIIYFKDLYHKGRGEYRHHNLFINTGKFYAENGKVFKTVDFRQKEKYPICYKEAYLIAKRWKPRKYEINHMERSFIVNKQDTIYTWEVHMTPPTNPKAKGYLYTIDAKSGEKLKKVRTIISSDDEV